MPNFVRERFVKPRPKVGMAFVKFCDLGAVDCNCAMLSRVIDAQDAPYEAFLLAWLGNGPLPR